jgi:hypothetical protein
VSSAFITVPGDGLLAIAGEAASALSAVRPDLAQLLKQGKSGAAQTQPV